jgi:CRISPR/Cas system-associated exonuclease Cas4 (RecB family)
MAEWKTQLESFDSMLKELQRIREDQTERLRFGRSIIIVSDIAEQYYCEKKVEMQYLHGEIETEEKSIGSLAHEKLEEDAVKVKREAMWKEIYGKKPVFAVEMFILAKYKDVVLGGKPDSILFQAGHPLVVFEFKFSRSRIAYSTHHIQAQTYGAILDRMGFDTSHLFYAIVTADPKTRGSRKFRKEATDAVIKNGQKEGVLEIEDATIHVHKFSLSDIENNLLWAIDYWKQNREATATNNPNKCCRCEYQTQCQTTV